MKGERERERRGRKFSGDEKQTWMSCELKVRYAYELYVCVYVYI